MQRNRKSNSNNVLIPDGVRHRVHTARLLNNSPRKAANKKKRLQEDLLKQTEETLAQLMDEQQAVEDPPINMSMDNDIVEQQVPPMWSKLGPIEDVRLAGKERVEEPALCRQGGICQTEPSHNCVEPRLINHLGEEDALVATEHRVPTANRLLCPCSESTPGGRQTHQR